MKNAGELFKWLIAGLAGGGITFAFLYLLGANVSLPFYEKPKQETASKTYPDFEPLEPTEAPRKTAEEIFWENIAADERRKAEENSARQTSFNDQNYTPRTDINTMQAPKVTYATNNKQQRQQEKGKGWTWYTYKHANRDRKRLYIEWSTVNGWIELPTICQNERRGSIEYRTCRKAAKEYFTKRCREGGPPAFCRAQSFNPL